MLAVYRKDSLANRLHIRIVNFVASPCSWCAKTFTSLLVAGMN